MQNLYLYSDGVETETIIAYFVRDGLRKTKCINFMEFQKAKPATEQQAQQNQSSLLISGYRFSVLLNK